MKEKKFLFDEYFDLYEQYAKKHEKFALFYQIGSFYELYGVDNSEDKIGNIVEVCRDGELNISKSKAKNCNTREKPMKAGFPVDSLGKYSKILLDKGYDIVVYSQDKENKKVRIFDKTITKGTYISEENTPDTNYMMSLYVDAYDDKLDIGIATIDVSTGKNICYNVIDSYPKANELVNRIIAMINPSELLIIENSHFQKETSKKIIFNKKFTQPSFQNELLSEIFPNIKNTPVEYLGIYKYPSIIVSLVHLYDYIYKHDPRILSYISKPSIKNHSQWVTLSNRTVQQLNLVGGKYSLFNIIDRTSTNMGKRLLKSILTIPIIDVDTLNERYDQLSYLLENKKYIDLEKLLDGLPDIEKIHRKLFLKRIYPSDLCILEEAYMSIWKVITYLKKFKELRGVLYKLISEESIMSFRKMVTLYHKHLNIEEASKCKNYLIESPIFKVGIFQDLDEVNCKLETYKKELEDYCMSFGEESLKVDYRDSPGYFLTTNARKAKELAKLHKNIVVDKSTKTCIKITDENIRKLSNRICHYKKKIVALNNNHFTDFIEILSDNFASALKNITSFVATIDVLKSNAKSADINKYCHPKIVIKDHSFIDAQQLRHPIVERINDKSKFIPNDVVLDGKSILLYGVNGSGKSIFLKSVATSVIMAQCGMYVPAKKFVYNPFETMVSKISMMDSMEEGKSTFECEMLDVKDMIVNNGPKNLCLADELCSGTGTLDAISLVAATVDQLSKEGSSFIFTTHLHQLSDVLKDDFQGTLQIKHMSSKIDKGEFVHERLLKDGMCPINYGIEIAKQFGVGNDIFYEKALKVLRSLSDKPQELVAVKSSRYNKKVRMNKCSKCGTTKNLHSHHIDHQKDANEHGMIDTFHKNSKFNLEVLCVKCHAEEHVKDKE